MINIYYLKIITIHYTCRKQLINEENISIEVRYTQNMIEGYTRHLYGVPMFHGCAGSNIKVITSSDIMTGNEMI